MAPSHGGRRLAVALIRPPVVVYPRSLSGHGPTPSIGLAYLAAAVRKAGHQVTVIDAAGEDLTRFEDFPTAAGTMRRVGLSPRAVVDRIDDEIDVVGISSMFLHEWPQCVEIAEFVAERYPDKLVVVGGETPTALGRDAFDDSDAIHAVVSGEGESTFVALLDRLAAGDDTADIDGLLLRQPIGPRRRHGTEPQRLPDRLRRLDELDRPAWDLFPIEEYLDHPDYFGVERGRSLPLLGTRGCPYRCTFCSSPQMWTTRYSVREPEDVAAEMVEMIRRYGVENFDFADLTAITKRNWTLKLCDAIEAQHLDITWQLPVGTRAEALDEEVLQRLHDTGCRNVTYAPESGSRRMLDVFDKRVDLDHVLTSIRAAHRIGLRTHCNVIIGHPEERRRDRWETFLFLLRAAAAGCDGSAAIMFTAYPGSVDYDRLVAEGKVKRDEAFHYIALTRASFTVQSFNKQASTRELVLSQLFMMVTFQIATVIRNPLRLVDRVRSWRSGKEATHLDQTLRIKVRGFQPRSVRSAGSHADAARRRQPLLRQSAVQQR